MKRATDEHEETEVDDQGTDGGADGFAATPLAAAGRRRQRYRRERSRRCAWRNAAGRTPVKLPVVCEQQERIFLSHPKSKSPRNPSKQRRISTPPHLVSLTRTSLDCDTLTKMLSSQAPNRALRLSLRARHFSTCRPLAAVSPYRSPTPATNPQKKVDKRTQSTAAAAQAAHTSPARAVPSPAFNRSAKDDVQPLQAFRQPEMDHSFTGMNGGQIFHEMMLRHDVKHVCE
jgi:hypothetical protein